MPRRTRSADNASLPTSPKRTRRETSHRESRHMRDEALGDSNGRRLRMSDMEFFDLNKALKAIENNEASELRVKELDEQVTENRKAHHTDEYEHSCLIVRRGQPFTLSITFDRDFNKDTDAMLLQLMIGSRPLESKGTVLRVAVTAPDAASEGAGAGERWRAEVSGQDGARVDVTVTPPPNAIVGRYALFVETDSHVDGTSFTHRQAFQDLGFILLFNPWCKEDIVYMEDDAWRMEYVMNESGRIYNGAILNVGSIEWNFGQFEDVSLDAALYLMDRAELAMPARANPIHVVRCMSAMSNSNDDDGGVLTGRWSDAYPKDTTMPWMWTGSVAILDQYMRNKKAVKYGQCWVFSGVVTTLLRALGIGTRSVTNFESAHDCDGSVTIDYHWGEDDKPIEHMNDSVWNFHVWNESWFLRNDLPEGNDGWQAHDATPQESSEGVMRCGPAPVAAIKEGNVYLPYDAKFIFAEVNGDKVHWLVKEKGDVEMLLKEPMSVGMHISTKAIGDSNKREDLTDNYKHPEGSDSERAAVERAFRYSSRRQTHNIYEVPEPDVKFTLDTPEQLTIGHDFALTVHLTNKTEQERTVRCRVAAVVSYYTGVPAREVAEHHVERKLAPTAEGVEASASSYAESFFSLPVTFDELQHALTPEAVVTVYLKGTVKETGRSYAHMASFPLAKPGIALTCDPPKVKVGESFDLTMSFTNSLPRKLSGGVFHIEASGITRGMVLPYKKAIGAGETVTHTVTLTPRRSGNKEVMVNFSSNEVAGMHGSAEIYVSYNYG